MSFYSSNRDEKQFEIGNGQDISLQQIENPQHFHNWAFLL